MDRSHFAWYVMLCHWVIVSQWSTGFSALNMLRPTHLTWHHIPGDLNPQQYCCENLKSEDILCIEDTKHEA